MPEHLFSFVIACVVIELTPGPNMAYLAALSSMYGRKAGFSMVAGIASGLLAIGLISVFGVDALLAENPALYRAMQWAGVGYMLYLAWEHWRSSMAAPMDGARFDVRYFERGLITNILNPKALLFYVSVVPNFIRAGEASEWPYLVLTLVYVLVATMVHSAIVLLAEQTQRIMHTPKSSKIARSVFTLSLLAIALWLTYKALES